MMELTREETVFRKDYDTLVNYATNDNPHNLNSSCSILRKWLLDDGIGSISQVATANSIIIQYAFNQPDFSNIKGNLIWLSLGDALWRDDIPMRIPDLQVTMKSVKGEQSSFLNNPVLLIYNPSKQKREELNIRNLINSGCYLAAVIHIGQIDNKKEVSPFFQAILEQNLLLRDNGEDVYAYIHYDIKAVLIVVLHAWWELYSRIVAKESSKLCREDIFNHIGGINFIINLRLEGDIMKLLRGAKVKFSVIIRKQPNAMCFPSLELV